MALPAEPGVRYRRGVKFVLPDGARPGPAVPRHSGVPAPKFRHGFIYINTSKNISNPKDLIGKKVGIQSFQVSANLWLRGILESKYGISHKSIEVCRVRRRHRVHAPADLKLSRLGPSDSIEDMLVRRELDAVMHSDIITPILQRDPRVGRLFPNFKSEEESYYRKTSIFPIMHVMAIRKDVIER
ncbi:MAG: 4,5-dihydroxyphthalate decarboxylase [Alphaproteobacteria bacterium]|nr:4,5-dihydroxyphthalate decarboxylase [Alphaproteobacteria bacterium]